MPFPSRKSVHSKLAAKTRKMRGASLLGYGMIVGLVAVAAIGAITDAGSAIRSNFTTTANELEGVSQGSGSGAAVIGVASHSINIDAITDGGSLGPCTAIAVNNTGNATANGLGLSPMGGANPANFSSCIPSGSACSGSLQAGQSCNLGVQLVASGDGSYTATATLDWSDGVGIALDFAGNASGYSANLVWSATGADSMDITSGSSPGGTISATLTNSGSVTSSNINGTISIAGANPGNFEITQNNCTAQLDPGLDCTIDLRPLASENGSYTALLVTAAENAPQLALSGTASGFPEICPVDTYWNGSTCQQVAIGQYAAEGSSSPSNCSNKPDSSTYTGRGNGSNNCPWSCNSGTVAGGNFCHTPASSCGSLVQYQTCGGYYAAETTSINNINTCRTYCINYGIRGCCVWNSDHNLCSMQFGARQRTNNNSVPQYTNAANCD